MDSFKRNKALISMKDIPEDISNLILENYNESLEKQELF